jgi:hypothetical protein
VHEASDGREALAKAITMVPDVIVSESRLPGMSGYDFCSLLRRDARGHRPAEAVLARTALCIHRAAAPAQPERSRSGNDSPVKGRPATRPSRRTAPPVGRPLFAPPDHPEGRASAPELLCPSCDGPLHYERSHIGGVSSKHAEQWDYFLCPRGCGTFQYRERTRKLRSVG